jgi:hypothetical protein
MTEDVETFWELIHRDRHRTGHELADTVWISWSLPKDLNRKFDCIPHRHEICSLSLDKWPQAAMSKCMSWATRDGKQGPNFVCCFALFPNLERTLTWDALKQCLTCKRNRDHYSTVFRKMTFVVRLNHWKNDRVAVDISKKTILKEVAAKIKLSQHSFFVLGLELPGSPHMFSVTTIEWTGLIKRIFNIWNHCTIIYLEM